MGGGVLCLALHMVGQAFFIAKGRVLFFDFLPLSELVIKFIGGFSEIVFGAANTFANILQYTIRDAFLTLAKAGKL